MSDFWLGIIGTAVGSVLTLASQWSFQWLSNRKQRKFDKDRKALLKTMMANPGPDGWKKMSTMSGVIGATRDETARLLIEMGARGSEKAAATGNDVWAYIKDKPLAGAE